MKYLNFIKNFFNDPEVREAGKKVREQLTKGVVFGMGLPVGIILAFHVFWMVGQVLIAFGLQHQ